MSTWDIILAIFMAPYCIAIGIGVPCLLWEAINMPVTEEWVDDE